MVNIDSKKILKEIKALQAEISRHDEAYHTKDSPLISDAEYDSLRKKLDEYQDNYPQLFDYDFNKKVGGKTLDIFPKIKNIKNSEIILFIGPEGGFTSEEFKCFDNLKNCYKLNLGPRILRADTAIISSLTLIQEFLGDFNLKPKLYVD